MDLACASYVEQHVMGKIEDAKKKAIAARKRRSGKCETPWEKAMQTASIKLFEKRFDAAVKALSK